MERPVGIEPTWSAWKAEARPLGEGRLVVVVVVAPGAFHPDSLSGLPPACGFCSHSGHSLECVPGKGEHRQKPSFNQPCRDLLRTPGYLGPVE